MTDTMAFVNSLKLSKQEANQISFNIKKENLDFDPILGLDPSSIFCLALLSKSTPTTRSSLQKHYNNEKRISTWLRSFHDVEKSLLEKKIIHWAINGDFGLNPPYSSSVSKFLIGKLFKFKQPNSTLDTKNSFHKSGMSKEVKEQYVSNPKSTENDFTNSDCVNSGIKSLA